VILNGRDSGKLGRAVTQLRDQGVKAHGFAFDVADSGQVDSAIGKIREQLGAIDILVNNAGIHLRAPLEQLTDDTWNEVLGVNLTGAFYVARAVAPGMIERKRGKIINICSLMSELGRETTGSYAAAKGGLKMLTRAMTVEWAKHNIQVNGIGPGYFITPMTRKLADDPEFDKWLRGRTPAGRWGKPEELIGPAVFLASRASDFVNGQIIYVDGGILAGL
jgi:gluconate 5-dehydrogenase